MRLGSGTISPRHTVGRAGSLGYEWGRAEAEGPVPAPLQGTAQGRHSSHNTLLSSAPGSTFLPHRLLLSYGKLARVELPLACPQPSGKLASEQLLGLGRGAEPTTPFCAFYKRGGEAGGTNAPQPSPEMCTCLCYRCVFEVRLPKFTVGSRGW